ncbi:hypothetical protein [Neolewinella persica]|uniref:hypothetical protein n=1 Tax=Neolewinella persica TaxID=70998 RepID=UPI0003A6011A|nr:hypothetical protein [Neolewinella persica]
MDRLINMKPLFLLLLLSGGLLHAQLPLTPEIQVLLDSLDIRVNHPFDADFKLLRNPENDYLADQLTVRSKTEKLEIRLHLRPETANDLYYQRPHMRVGLLVMNLASNADDAVTTVHSFDDEELAVLNADWARMYTFRPKTSYSPHATAQLIAIYKADRGLAYTVLLFDDAPDTLEGRQLLLRFR